MAWARRIGIMGTARRIMGIMGVVVMGIVMGMGMGAQQAGWCRTACSIRSCILSVCAAGCKQQQQTRALRWSLVMA